MHCISIIRANTHLNFVFRENRHFRSRASGSRTKPTRFSHFNEVHTDVSLRAASPICPTKHHGCGPVELNALAKIKIHRTLRETHKQAAASSSNEKSRFLQEISLRLRRRSFPRKGKRDEAGRAPFSRTSRISRGKPADA